MTNQDLANRLRALAQVYEENPGAAQLYDFLDVGRLSVFCHDKEVTAATIRAFGPGDKKDDPAWIEYIPVLFPEVKIHVYKADVCERVKVGEREVEAVTIPAKPATEEVVIPARVEEVWEWRCGALLAPGGEANDIG